MRRIRKTSYICLSIFLLSSTDPTTNFVATVKENANKVTLKQNKRANCLRGVISLNFAFGNFYGITTILNHKAYLIFQNSMVQMAPYDLPPVSLSHSIFYLSSSKFIMLYIQGPSSWLFLQCCLFLHWNVLPLDPPFAVALNSQVTFSKSLSAIKVKSYLI